jgi:hypothetical protein
MQKTGWVRAGGAIVLISLSAALAGCGSSHKAAAPAAANAQPARPKHVITAEEIAVADMISAVKAGRQAAPVELKFEMDSRPSPGEPLEVRFALIPGAVPVAQVAASFQGEDGLEVVRGGQTPALEKPVPGMPVLRSVTVMPKADGIYTLTATVSTEADGQTTNTTFAIPVIAGTGLPELTAKSQPARPAPPDAGAATAKAR